MKRRDLADIVLAVFVLAIITLMVRPDSVAPAFLQALGAALTSLIGFTADPQTGATAPGGTGGTLYA